MKTIILTTAIALGLAAPAFAGNDNLTTAQKVELHFAASETGSDARIYFDESNGHSTRAAAIFAELTAEDTGTKPLPVQAGKPVNYSSKGGHSARAAAIFAEISAMEDGNER